MENLYELDFPPSLLGVWARTLIVLVLRFASVKDLLPYVFTYAPIPFRTHCRRVAVSPLPIVAV